MWRLKKEILNDTEKEVKFIIPELADTDGYYTCPNDQCERK